MKRGTPKNMKVAQIPTAAARLEAAATEAARRARAALAKIQNELVANPITAGRLGATWADVADLERLAYALECAAGIE